MSRPFTSGTRSADIDDGRPAATDLRSWGIDPRWSRSLTIPGSDGRPVRWHILDSGQEDTTDGTVVCVHGNPTWSYIWRDLLAEKIPGWRIVAVDQTGMGWSERGRPRRLADRIDELVSFCRQEIAGPLVLAAHDWGGPVAVGASGRLEVEALILANTAVAKPDTVAVPPLIAAARSLVDVSCRATPAFVSGTAHMTGRQHRAPLIAPYRSASRREAVRDFVADIPVRPTDPSHPALAAGAQVLTDNPRPTLVLWGGRDPVFHDRFLADLCHRLPDVDIERFPDAAHLVTLDAPIAPVVARWLQARRWGEPGPRADGPMMPDPVAPLFRSVAASIAERSADQSVVYRGPDGSLTWAELSRQSDRAASSLTTAGLDVGDRIAVLVPPGADLLVATAGIWAVGAVPVLADPSAGLRSLRRLLRAAAPRAVVGTPTTLAVARLLGFTPGAVALCTGRLPGVPSISASNGPRATVHQASPEDIAAIVHTSGATGPAKAVRYTHGALAAQRAVVGPLLGMQPGQAFTTSFAPFLLLAPALEMASVRPDIDVSSPGDLGFDELQAATAQGNVTVAWLSPASARKILATAEGRTLPLDLVMLAGAPISSDIVRGMRAVTGGDVRTPYGMTECLPVTDGSDPEQTGSLGGTPTGRPVPGCRVHIRALGSDGLTELPEGAWGEILVGADWMFDGYVGAWSADAATWVSHPDGRLHRTGDVGYLENGRLFHLGRVSHVIQTPHGPQASVALEEPVAAELARPVAAVGIGPRGGSLIALVVEAEGPLRVAGASLTATARAACPHQVAAVLEGAFPLDRRHHSKVDRVALAHAVGTYLEGR